MELLISNVITEIRMELESSLYYVWLLSSLHFAWQNLLNTDCINAYYGKYVTLIEFWSKEIIYSINCTRLSMKYLENDCLLLLLIEKQQEHILT